MKRIISKHFPIMSHATIPSFSHRNASFLSNVRLCGIWCIIVSGLGPLWICETDLPSDFRRAYVDKHAWPGVCLILWVVETKSEDSTRCGHQCAENTSTLYASLAKTTKWCTKKGMKSFRLKLLRLVVGKEMCYTFEFISIFLGISSLLETWQ